MSSSSPIILGMPAIHWIRKNLEVLLLSVVFLSLAYLTGYIQGLAGSPHGDGLRLARDPADAQCFATLEEHLRAWHC